MKPTLQSICRVLLLPVLAAGALVSPAQAQDAEALIDRAMTGSHRSDANKARDKYRHPKETLLFFGLKPEYDGGRDHPRGGLVHRDPGAGHAWRRPTTRPYSS